MAKYYIIGKERTIKDLLMDQKFISGLGNIYVNEILFFSRVKPNKKIKDLSNNEIKEIINELGVKKAYQQLKSKYKISTNDFYKLSIDLKDD